MNLISMRKLARRLALSWKGSGVNVNKYLFECNKECRCLETTQIINSERVPLESTAVTLVNAVLLNVISNFGVISGTILLT